MLLQSKETRRHGKRVNFVGGKHPLYTQIMIEHMIKDKNDNTMKKQDKIT